MIQGCPKEGNLGSRLVDGPAVGGDRTPLLPGKPGDPGQCGEDNRLSIEAVLWWLVRAGAPWLDLPPRFGTDSFGR